MNNKEKELHDAIARTERFSGYDGYDSAEGDMGMFDSDDFNNFDADYANAGGNQSQETSDPYILQYVNSTTADVTAILFGANDYAQSTNYGNPTAVTVTSLQGGTYGRMLNQSTTKAFKIGEFRFISSTASQLTQTLTQNIVDANGLVAQKPLNMSVLKDIYQYSTDTIVVKKVFTIDGNTFFTFPLKANTKFVISMYPIKIFSLTDFIKDDLKANQYALPSIDGQNTSPIIINTYYDLTKVAVIKNKIIAFFKKLFTKKQS